MYHLMFVCSMLKERKALLFVGGNKAPYAQIAVCSKLRNTVIIEYQDIILMRIVSMVLCDACS